MAITFELYTGDSSGVASPSQKPNTAYLKSNNWDDYGFKTLFALVVFDSSGVRHDIGSIKIGCKEHKAGWISKLIDARFKSLGENFFSLGQDEEYYSNIQSLDPDLRVNLLSSLRDIVSDEKVYSIAIEEDIFKTSLLREVSLTSVSGQFKRILQGGSIRTEFHFRYEIPQGKRVAGLALEFHVDPELNKQDSQGMRKLVEDSY